VVQEVLLGLWQRKTEININDLEAWLSAATRYSVFRQLARFGSQKVVSISSQGEGSYLQDFDTRFIQTILRERVNLLPEKCKLVFNYSREHQLSNREIADKLEISEKTVEKHITTALGRLKTQLKSTLSR
jgi:RNA polymerase sigma-70 factor (ECF subfamily)